MIKSLQDLADGFNIINYNIRELLFKLYIWNTTSDSTVIITLKTKDEPFIEQFIIPSKNSLSKSIQSSWQNPKKLTPVVKNWGKYSTNSSLSSPITLTKTISPDVNYLCYDGVVDANGVIQFTLSNTNASNGDIFEFVASIATPFDYSDNKLVQFFDGNISPILLCGFGNAPISQFSDTLSTTIPNEKLVYKVSFQYILPDGATIGQWVLFDFYLLPNYQYNGSREFNKKILFKDPTNI